MLKFSYFPNKSLIAREQSVRQRFLTFACATGFRVPVYTHSFLGVFQFRPAFPYMEKGLKRKKDAGDQEEPVEEQAGPSSAQQVTVKFKNTDDRWKKHEIRTYKALLAKRAEEAWNDYSWYDKSSTCSEVCL